MLKKHGEGCTDRRWGGNREGVELVDDKRLMIVSAFHVKDFAELLNICGTKQNRHTLCNSILLCNYEDDHRCVWSMNTVCAPLLGYPIAALSLV